MDTAVIWALFISLLDLTLNVLGQDPRCPRERCDWVEPSCRIHTTYIHNGIECEACPLDRCNGRGGSSSRPGRERNRDPSPVRDRNRDPSPGRDRNRETRPGRDRNREPRPGRDRNRDLLLRLSRNRDPRPGLDRNRDLGPGLDRNRDPRRNFRDRSRRPDTRSDLLLHPRDRLQQNSERSLDRRQIPDQNPFENRPFPSDPFIREIPPSERNRQQRILDPFPTNPDPTFFSDLPPRRGSGTEMWDQRGRSSTRDREPSRNNPQRNRDNQSSRSRGGQHLMSVRPVSPFDMTETLGNNRAPADVNNSVRERNRLLPVEFPPSSATSNDVSGGSGLASILEGTSTSFGSDGPVADFSTVQQQTQPSADQQSSPTNPSNSQQQTSAATTSQVPNPALNSLPQRTPFPPNQMPFPMPQLFGIPFSPVQMQAVSALIAQMRLQTGVQNNQLLQPLRAQLLRARNSGSPGTQSLGLQNLGAQASGMQPFGGVSNPSLPQNSLMQFPGGVTTDANTLGFGNFQNPSQPILPQTSQNNQRSSLAPSPTPGSSIVSDEELHRLLAGVTSLDADGRFVSTSASRDRISGEQVPGNLIGQNALPTAPGIPAFPNGNPSPTVPGFAGVSSGNPQRTSEGSFPAFDLSVLFNSAANQQNIPTGAAKR